jgi:DNA-binding response OmpR family regulator
MTLPSILIIDDDETICFLFKCNLEESGFAVETIFSPEEGIQKLEANDYDLLILDLNLGALTGADVLQSVNFKNKKTKILVASGYHSSSTIHTQVRQLGVTEFISKPSSKEDLLFKIKSMLNIT